MDNVALYLSPDHRQYAESLALDTFERYRDVKGHYRNLLSSHTIGRYGEMGAYQFFVSRRIDAHPYFSNSEYDSLCDIKTKVGRCEVKTWSDNFWNDWGRAVSVAQLPYLEKKADFILWCSALMVNDLVRVDIHGWNTVADMTIRPPMLMGPANNQVENYQLDISEMRPIQSLVEFARNQGVAQR